MPEERVVRYVHDANRVSDWFSYAHSYFIAAKTVAEGQREARELLSPPLLYLVRHGIELLLKYLDLVTGFDLERSHDIHTLLVRVGQSLRAIDDESVKHAASGLSVDEELIRKFLEVSAHRIEEIVEKYGSCSFVNDVKLVDPNNEAFRYPSVTSVGTFDPQRFSGLSSEEITSDVGELEEFMMAVTIAFGRQEDGRHFLADKG